MHFLYLWIAFYLQPLYEIKLKQPQGNSPLARFLIAKGQKALFGPSQQPFQILPTFKEEKWRKEVVTKIRLAKATFFALSSMIACPMYHLIQ
ncbi:hypothetical protein VNO77_33480 [Canavalia gladiata]|uniref:Uncharacterized protein n=1 Tax=Canavalia gladiata TaxID=3824 RepID=A0AAN9KDY7_CANGL